MYKPIPSIYENIFIIFQSKQECFQNTNVYSQSTRVHSQPTRLYHLTGHKQIFQCAKIWFESRKVYPQSAKMHFQPQNYTSKYISKRSPYKSIIWKYKRIRSWYKNIPSKYKGILSKNKCSFKLSTNFRNLGNEISGTRNFLSTSRSGNPVPRTGSVQTSGTDPSLSEPIEHHNCRNYGHATFRTRTFASGPEPGLPEPVQNPSVPGTGSRTPGSFPEPPQAHWNPFILCKNSQAFLRNSAVGEKSVRPVHFTALNFTYLHAHWQERFKHILKCCFQTSRFCAATAQIRVFLGATVHLPFAVRENDNGCFLWYIGRCRTKGL